MKFLLSPRNSCKRKNLIWGLIEELPVQPLSLNNNNNNKGFLCIISNPNK